MLRKWRMNTDHFTAGQLVDFLYRMYSFNAETSSRFTTYGQYIESTRYPAEVNVFLSLSISPAILVRAIKAIGPSPEAASVGSAPPAAAPTSEGIASHLAHLQQLGVDLLLGLAQDFDQVLGLLHVRWGEECVCCARTRGSCCAPNTMDVVLRAGRVIEVDYKLDVTDVVAAMQTYVEIG